MEWNTWNLFSAFRVENDSWIIFVIALIHTIVMTDPNIKYYSFISYLLLYCYALPYLLFLLLVVAKIKRPLRIDLLIFCLLLSYFHKICSFTSFNLIKLYVWIEIETSLGIEVCWNVIKHELPLKIKSEKENQKSLKSLFVCHDAWHG